MSSVNDYQRPLSRINLRFNTPSNTSVNALFSGSRAVLAPLGFTISRDFTSNSYTIIMPITDASTESGFATTVTDRTSMRTLEIQVQNTVIPTLIIDWTSAGSPTPVSDSNPDIEADEEEQVFD